MTFGWNAEQMREHQGASEETSWEHVLERLKRSTEWDPSTSRVALLGCGAYGVPLASHAKTRNMSAVYVGGLLPALFGIAGKRHRETFASSLNEAWISPLPEETPAGNERVEGGAYWG